MATLQDYYGRVSRSLESDIEKYSLDNFIETGTGLGDTVSYALRNGFSVKNIYSFEIYEDIAKKAIDRFIGYPYCNIIGKDSYEGLKELLPTLEGNSMFFLDAHFPGADFGYTKYSDNIDHDLKLPLQKEIELICNSRDISNDVFLIDDLRIYEEANYEMGNWPKENGAVHTGTDFITEAFDKTHTIEKHYFYSGFITILPKNK